MDDETMNSKSKIFWTRGPVIIGAGPSGLAVSACLKQRGIPSLILEKESCIGSLWKLKTYDALQLHLPKKFCQLPYVKFPSEYPTYPTKQQFISYLEDYASHFSINPMLGQEVQWAKYEESKECWRVKTNEHEYRCRWLIVATGENAEPVMPRIPGVSEFRGTLLHTSAYKDGAPFRGRKALVVGCGNSGMETSLDLCKNGAKVSIVIRNKFHILPKQVLGNSTFALSMWLLKWFPVETVDWFLLLCSRLIIGDTNQSGIRRPEIGPLKLKISVGKTPVLDDGAFAKIKSGEIKVVNAIRKFTTSGVEFADGTLEDFDAVILATGYKNNTTSWLQEANFFHQKNGHRKSSLPNNWKGQKGVYSVGFTAQGLLGASMDAQKVAEDIAQHWNSTTEKYCLDG
ncbi:indole-3-pyruvate monooxygenase YUCCA6-like [Pistacia vera]|uniref:indole-3-pyruvate monooxygenase YUCCA6-like n=1 Tax=Pistacia vera TaxID=55513 RepID=UPI001262FF0E|nr:indole-3-pyruvate monooxygenase YUCCA6-like [Pistacia vera]